MLNLFGMASTNYMFVNKKSTVYLQELNAPGNLVAPTDCGSSVCPACSSSCHFPFPSQNEPTVVTPLHITKHMWVCVDVDVIHM